MKVALVITLLVTTVALAYLIFFPTHSFEYSVDDILLADEQVGLSSSSDEVTAIKDGSSSGRELADNTFRSLDSLEIARFLDTANFRIALEHAAVQTSAKFTISDTINSAEQLSADSVNAALSQEAAQLYDVYSDTRKLNEGAKDSAFVFKADSIIENKVIVPPQSISKSIIYAEEIQLRYKELVSKKIDEKIEQHKAEVKNYNKFDNPLFFIAAISAGLVTLFSALKAGIKNISSSNIFLYTTLVLTFTSTLANSTNKFFNNSSAEHKKVVQSLIEIRRNLIKEYKGATTLDQKELVLDEYETKLLEII